MPTARELSELLDRELDQKLIDIESVDWSEDYISLILVDSLRRILRNVKTITVQQDFWSGDEGVFFEIEAYKATGALERRCGDIAIIIHNMDLGRIGTGFYEAKAEGAEGGYPAYNMRQLRRLTTSTPQLALLLYERSPKVVSDGEYPFFNYSNERGRARSMLRVIGANIAKKYPRPNFIPDLPLSFGRHFVSRYLSGMDLDYSRDPHLTIQKWIKVTRRASPVVVSIRFSKTPIAFTEPARIPLQNAEKIPFMLPKGLSERHLNQREKEDSDLAYQMINDSQLLGPSRD